jgi:hypothetical protein
MPSPTLAKVNSSYGAPMGRHGSYCEPMARLYLQRIRLDSGGYDSGGAYWGHGAPIYWATDGQPGGLDMTLRARSRDAAKAAIRAEFPDCNVTFWR